MKPRNLKEKHIVELNGRLRPLTTPQMNWALNSTINHYGYRLKSGMCTCMKCGHERLETRNGMCLCPECGTRIEIKDTKERVIRDKSYFNVITTMEGYQVIRMFLMIVEMRKGMKANPVYLEIGSYWIDPKAIGFLKLQKNPLRSIPTGVIFISSPRVNLISTKRVTFFRRQGSISTDFSKWNRTSLHERDILEEYS